jgi:hypothetical protein
MGRTKKNRRKAPKEKMKQGVKTFTKSGVTIHCSVCGKANHKKGAWQIFTNIDRAKREQYHRGG